MQELQNFIEVDFLPLESYQDVYCQLNCDSRVELFNCLKQIYEKWDDRRKELSFFTDLQLWLFDIDESKGKVVLSRVSHQGEQRNNYFNVISGAKLRFFDSESIEWSQRFEWIVGVDQHVLFKKFDDYEEEEIEEYEELGYVKSFDENEGEVLTKNKCQVFIGRAKE